MEDLQEIKGFLEIDGRILLKQGDAVGCLRQLPTNSVDPKIRNYHPIHD